MSAGIGAMLHALGGGSPKSASDYYGRTISAVAFSDDELRLTFSDGVTIKVWDDGQSCCESRYMRTDDNPQDLVGRSLVSIGTKEGPDEEGEYGDIHEVVFLEVKAGDEIVTFSSHNEHNGYYGGFGLSLDEVTQAAVQ